MGEDPPERLLDLLAAQRRGGATFSVAWSIAGVSGVDGHPEREEWSDALRATRLVLLCSQPEPRSLLAWRSSREYRSS